MCAIISQPKLKNVWYNARDITSVLGSSLGISINFFVMPISFTVLAFMFTNTYHNTARCLHCSYKYFRQNHVYNLLTCLHNPDTEQKLEILCD